MNRLGNVHVLHVLLNGSVNMDMQFCIAFRALGLACNVHVLHNYLHVQLNRSITMDMQFCVGFRAF